MKKSVCIMSLSLTALLFVSLDATAQVKHRRPYTSSAGVNAYYDTDGVKGNGSSRDYLCRGDSYDGHSGTDFGLSVGSTIVASAAGTVTRTNNGCANYGGLGSTCGGYLGNWVELSHSDGSRTVYAHMQLGSIRVSTGQRVSCGQVLGRSASSGNSSGPHLHYGSRAGASGSWSISSTRATYKGSCGRNSSLWVNQGAYQKAPGTACQSQDSDGDGKNDNVDNCPDDRNGGQADRDSDGVGNVCDNCPGKPNSGQRDSDGDGIGNVCDNCKNIKNSPQNDRDDDGVGNICDNCPGKANPGQADRDKDGVGNVCDNCPDDKNAGQKDDDGDGVGNVCDNCKNVKNRGQKDFDEDGKGNACDPDDDNDGVPDEVDNCPFKPNAGQLDSDGDGKGNACQDDDDSDGVLDADDNCLRTPNPDQSDIDGDGKGDACDDSDGDGITDEDELEVQDFDRDGIDDQEDNCADAENTSQDDLDADGIGDACDSDIDDDGVENALDLCPMTFDEEQVDLDDDGMGDACDPDVDGDGIDNANDNCPEVENADQADSDADGIGDACDDPLVEGCGSESCGDPGSQDGWELGEDGNSSTTVGEGGCQAAPGSRRPAPSPLLLLVSLVGIGLCASRRLFVGR